MFNERKFSLTIAISAIVLALAVILGAFGAHGLDGKIPAEALETYQTGVRYHFYHGFGMLCCLILAIITSRKGFIRVAYVFAAGILLFSGSLYVLSMKSLLGLENVRWLGPITPLGGLLFIAGWIEILNPTL
jgi:uncharacterized membrane protein YgdD (TMEM256/DUF423 family)